MTRHAARLLLAVSLVGIGVIAPAGASHACSCAAGRGTIEDAISVTPVVFVGTALHGRRVQGSDEEFDPWTFDVESVQRGRVRGRILVDTDSLWPVFHNGGRVGGSVSSCGFPVAAGRRYQIFARYKPSGTLITSTCSSSRSLEPTGRLSTSVEPYELTSEWPAVAIASGALVTLAGAIVARRAKRFS